MIKQNLHTHSIYCDGKDTPEEMVKSALEKGFTSIGFSEHSFMSYSPYFVSIGDKTKEYKKEVSRLKEVYKDKIKIYLGLEVDMYSQPDMTDYDYLIGSVHYFKIGKDYVGFDKGQNDVENVIDTYFCGNGMRYAKYYYETLAQLPDFGKFDIVGHFDLITKHSENKSFFDENSKEYLDAAFEAAEVLSKNVPFFEVNTGAVSRGYKKSPYPSIPILKYLKQLGFGAVVTSDCHNKDALDCCFDEASQLLSECGFKEKYVLDDSGFVPVAL